VAKPAPAIARPDKNFRLSIFFIAYYEKGKIDLIVKEPIILYGN
jgi:hypothetical protein